MNIADGRGKGVRSTWSSPIIQRRRERHGVVVEMDGKRLYHAGDTA